MEESFCVICVHFRGSFKWRGRESERDLMERDSNLNDDDEQKDRKEGKEDVEFVRCVKSRAKESVLERGTEKGNGPSISPSFLSISPSPSLILFLSMVL